MACNLRKKVPWPGVLINPHYKNQTNALQPARTPALRTNSPAGSAVASPVLGSVLGHDSVRGRGTVAWGQHKPRVSGRAGGRPQAFLRAVNEDPGGRPAQGRWGMRRNLGVVAVCNFLRKEPGTGDALPKLCK